MQPQTPQVPSGSPLPTDNNPTPPPIPQSPQAAAPVPPPAAPQPPVPTVAPVPDSPVNNTASSLPVQPVAPPPQPMPSSMASMPQPAPAPAITPEPQPVMTSSSYKQGRSFSKKIILASIIAGVLLLIGGGVFAFTKMNGGVKLVKYSDENLEMLYPEGYKKKSVAGGGVRFTEPEDKDPKDDGQSVIEADVSETPGDISESDKKKTFDKFEEHLKENDGSLDEDAKITIDKSERIKHNGNDAIKLRVTVKEGDKKVGTQVAMFAISKDKIYIISVAAHISDPDLSKKADTIVDSIKPK